MEINRSDTNSNFGFLLKTYKKDFERVQILVSTFNKHNSENIRLVIVAPKEDLNYLCLNESVNITLIEEESILDLDYFDTSVHGMSQGYLNQQIIKLKFWETRIFNYYFCIDSDLIFIKDFFVNDFMSPNGTPYTFTTSFYDLVSDPIYYNKFWRSRTAYFKTICDYLDYTEQIDFAIHGMTALSSTFLSEMRRSVAPTESRWYKNLLSKSPLEFSWYLVWCLKNGYEINRRESSIKTIHTKKEHIFYLLKGISLNDLRRSYIGIVINSNYAEKYNITEYEVPFLRFFIPAPNSILRHLR
jgi:hypothetical protein